jgi:putative transcriptional regulator
MECLEGKLLVAMPALVEPTFAQSVILLCAHSPEGALGLIINKPMPDTSFMDLADNLDLSKVTEDRKAILALHQVNMGGPVDDHRGFVLHEAKYHGDESSLSVKGRYSLSATVNVLQDIAENRGPKNYVLALGYSGCGPGQLEREIGHNGWLHCESDAKLVFHSKPEEIYRLALKKIGIDPVMLSADAGHG